MSGVRSSLILRDSLPPDTPHAGELRSPEPPQAPFGRDDSLRLCGLSPESPSGTPPEPRGLSNSLRSLRPLYLRFAPVGPPSVVWGPSGPRPLRGCAPSTSAYRLGFVPQPSLNARWRSLSPWGLRPSPHFASTLVPHIPYRSSEASFLRYSRVYSARSWRLVGFGA